MHQHCVKFIQPILTLANLAIIINNWKKYRVDPDIKRKSNFPVKFRKSVQSFIVFEPLKMKNEGPRQSADFDS